MRGQWPDYYGKQQVSTPSPLPPPPLPLLFSTFHSKMCFLLPPPPPTGRVAESIDPAGSGAGIGDDGHLGLMLPDLKNRVEGLPGADQCELYVIKVRVKGPW